jgi:hypothetical protein
MNYWKKFLKLRNFAFFNNMFERDPRCRLAHSHRQCELPEPGIQREMKKMDIQIQTPTKHR